MPREFIATHTGTVRVVGVGSHEVEHYEVRLRETKRYYVSSSGTKYRKNNGAVAPFSMWSRSRLDLLSVTPVSAQV